MAAKTIAQEYGKPAWMAMLLLRGARVDAPRGRNWGEERGEVLFGGLMFAHLQLMALSCLDASSWWCRKSRGVGRWGASLGLGVPCRQRRKGWLSLAA